MIKLQSERRFRALIEKSRNAVLLADADTTITYANPSAVKILGYDSETVRGMTILDLAHPRDKILIEKSIISPANEEDTSVEIRLQHYSGSWLWLECTITNLLRDPEVGAIFLTFRDVTGRKEMQQSVQAQRDLLLNLITIAQATGQAAELHQMLRNLVKIGKWLTLAKSGSVFLFNPLGELVYTNSSYGRLDPNRVQQLMNEGLCSWVVQNNRPTVVTDTVTDERWLKLPSVGPQPRSALAIPIHGDQGLQAILVLSHSRPNHFKDNHLKTLLAAGDHIAMALHNAQLYHQAQSDLADQGALIECSQDGFVLVNLEGRIRIINSAALKLLGLAGGPAGWIDHPVIDLIRRARHTSPRLIKIMIGEFNRVLKGDNEAADGEIQSSAHHINWMHTPITINNRNIGRLLVLRDITEQRKLEQQREELTDMIVHDLRNPASAVAGIVTMLKSLNSTDPLPDDYDQMMQLVERNVVKILDLVQEILDVSQLESGQLPVRKAPVYLDQLIEETLQLQRPIISMKEMILEATIQPDLPPVWADERLIRRVLQNLVDNAAKFSRRDTTITIWAGVEAGNPGYVQVSVQDQGVGIPVELQSRVFEKFVTNRQLHHGSGIGLTFCRLAVLAHDGRIWAESVENQGSTFHFTLPIAPKV
jgi:PAS domain S-box-containing protein